ncbi:MAG: hypothetical protein EBW49_07630 [Betaproteobacteria bacterium]|nr:hypothetical protein [Betaproteobacteria bacterium]
MQFAVDMARCAQVFLRVVKTAAMHCPHFAAYAFGLQCWVLRWYEVAVEKHKIKRGANPSNGNDDVEPTQ